MREIGTEHGGGGHKKVCRCQGTNQCRFMAKDVGGPMIEETLVCDGWGDTVIQPGANNKYVE